LYKSETTNLKVGGVNSLEGGEVNTVKTITLKKKKVGVHRPLPPPSSYGGAALALVYLSFICRSAGHAHCIVYSVYRPSDSYFGFGAIEV